ncbi:cytochrome P450 [Flavisphingomonas formosensis]|uniref:cytochrome P450 n=1 Tax=Flavisphingomonas formosensis TaxID=861534 RepID=UPI0012F9515F|nr:cytochrome P450 [Sphingomonas formosensis]
MTSMTDSIPDHVPADLVFPFDYRGDAQIRESLWDYLASMGDRPAMFFSPDLGGYWVVTTAALAEEVFSNHEIFSVRSVSVPKLESPVKLIPNNYDPPEHAPYRRMFTQNLFSPRALSSLEDVTRRDARALLNAMTPGRCEFVGEFAERLPIDVFLAGMGVDPAHREQFLPWVRNVFSGATKEEFGRGMAEASTFLAEWLKKQMEAPETNGGGMFQAMIASRIDGRALTWDEMHRITVMLFLGGLDTVTSEMSHVMYFLAGSPAHRQRLIDRPADIPKAVEEMLRRFSIANIGRIVVKDTDFHGVRLKAGDPVLIATPIVGLDESAFENATTVDFDRGRARGVRHLAFGAGPHLCPGAYLARTQLRVMLEELLPRMPGLRLQPGAKIEWRAGADFMVRELPLEWDAVGSA